MDRPLRGFNRQRREVRERATERQLRRQIARVLQTEKVAYGMEIARRIDVRIHRTIKKALETMFLEGELDRSDVDAVHKDIRVRFYWLRNTDERTVSMISMVKKQLLRGHMMISAVQKRFGPMLAITSLKALAQSASIPLSPESIEGPLTKWNGPNGGWSEDPIVIPYGDIDVLALESDGERLWIGEVKMRGDLLKRVQAEHFLASSSRFRRRIFTYKGMDYRLKIFILAPISTVSAREYCYLKNIELLECEKAYYPSETPKWGDLSLFYENYKKIMGFRNLEIVAPEDLPLNGLTRLMSSLGGTRMPDTI